MKLGQTGFCCKPELLLLHFLLENGNFLLLQHQPLLQLFHIPGLPSSFISCIVRLQRLGLQRRLQHVPLRLNLLHPRHQPFPLPLRALQLVHHPSQLFLHSFHLSSFHSSTLALGRLELLHPGSSIRQLPEHRLVLSNQQRDLGSFCLGYVVGLADCIISCCQNISKLGLECCLGFSPRSQLHSQLVHLLLDGR